MSLVLYDYTGAPSPRRTRIFLAEKGIEYANVQVDLAKQEQLGEEFRKVNPRCTVPALVLDDGAILTENTAIASYLEAAHPEPPLFGRSRVDAAKVWNWNAFTESNGLMAVAEVLRNSSPAMKDRGLTGPDNYAQIPALAERGAARLRRFFDQLDQGLEGREFLAVDSFSFADITALVVVDFARWVKAEPEAHHTNLRRWHEAVSARPSSQA